MGNIIIYKNDNKKTDLPIYTIEEVAKHIKFNDAWMVIKGYVYNVSNFNHPGGGIIATGYGKDATDLFYNPHVRHSSHAKKLLNKFLIGKLEITNKT
jgi:4-hydroxysphinganine ceramide fatty acyl 2-hydroxylase